MNSQIQTLLPVQTLMLSSLFLWCKAPVQQQHLWYLRQDGAQGGLVVPTGQTNEPCARRGQWCPSRGHCPWTTTCE